MGLEVFGIIAAAMLGSTVLNTFVTRFFRKENDHEEAGKTHAEATDIMAKAAETTLNIMQTTIYSQDERIKQQDLRIQRLEDRVMELHNELVQYKVRHGPLVMTGKFVEAAGSGSLNFEGTVE